MRIRTLVAIICFIGVAGNVVEMQADDLPEFRGEGRLGIWRETGLLSLFGLAYGVLVASLGFMFWLRLMGIYPASDIASFSFLSPVMAVVFGWLVFDEPVGPDFLGALALTSVGIVLINRRRKTRAEGPPGPGQETLRGQN